MNTIEIVTKCLKQGLEKAFYQNLVFKLPQEDLSVNLIEYLITIKVAEELFDSELRQIPDLSFHLEYNSDHFINNAFEKMRWKGKQFESKTNRRGDHFSCRKGRIDLAILKKSKVISLFNRSWIGIELKSVTKNLDLVLEDYDRLHEAMIEEDEVGENSIENCFIGMMLRLDKPKQLIEEEEYAQLKSDAITDLKQRIDEINESNLIEYNIEPFDIYKTTASEYAATIPEEWWDHNDIVANSGVVLGIIITLKRK